MRTINLVRRAFQLSPAEKPCTLPITILKDVGGDASKSSAKFELKVFLPSPTKGKVRELER